MSRVVWKYDLPPVPDAPHDVTVPIFSELLTFDLQNDDLVPVVWFLVNPDERSTRRHRFIWLMTGQATDRLDDLPTRGDARGYVATATARGFVAHLFEIAPR